MMTGVEEASLEDKHFFLSSKLASSTPVAGVEEAGVDEVRQPVAAG